MKKKTLLSQQIPNHSLIRNSCRMRKKNIHLRSLEVPKWAFTKNYSFIALYMILKYRIIKNQWWKDKTYL